MWTCFGHTVSWVNHLHLKSPRKRSRSSYIFLYPISSLPCTHIKYLFNSFGFGFQPSIILSIVNSKHASQLQVRKGKLKKDRPGKKGFYFPCGIYELLPADPQHSLRIILNNVSSLLTNELAFGIKGICFVCRNFLDQHQEGWRVTQWLPYNEDWLDPL